MISVSTVDALPPMSSDTTESTLLLCMCVCACVTLCVCVQHELYPTRHPWRSPRRRRNVYLNCYFSHSRSSMNLWKLRLGLCVCSSTSSSSSPSPSPSLSIRSLSRLCSARLKACRLYWHQIQFACIVLILLLARLVIHTQESFRRKCRFKYPVQIYFRQAWILARIFIKVFLSI